MEMLSINGLAVAGTFFQKKESPKIAYSSGRHTTELDILVVQQLQLRRAKDCRALAGESFFPNHVAAAFPVR